MLRTFVEFDAIALQSHLVSDAEHKVFCRVRWRARVRYIIPAILFWNAALVPPFPW
jgi:hypothetical protein